MSDQLVNELFKSPVVIGIAVVVCIAIIVMIFRSRSEYYSDDEHVKETFELDTRNYNEDNNEKNNDIISTFMNLPPLGTFEEVTRSGDIIENFPSAEMNVMYSDVNGNLATTRDLGLANLTVSGDSQFGDGKIGIKNGGTIYAPGRMHVHGEELLYILNKSGVIIGKEWGGNGNLNVQGNLFNNGQLNTNRLVVGEDMNGAYTGMSMKKHSDDWMVRMDNAKNNANVHMCHGAGYGMHINAQNNGSGQYILECHNGAKAVMTARGNGHVDTNGKLNVHAGAPWAIPNNMMADGSLTIGDVGKNYGGGDNWNGSTAGLLMECADVTEIAVHDAGTRVASAMYYNGPANTIEVGRNMAWGTSNLVAHGSIIANGGGAQNGWISGNFGLGDKDRVVIGNIEDIATVGSHNKDLNAWKRLRLWGETLELRSNDGYTRMQASGTFYSPGRMHIHGEELLYILNKSGVIIGKEWGGNGNLNVQGNLVNNGSLSVDGQIWTKNRLSACTEDPWGGAHTGLLVNKGADGWNTLIHNPNNGANVHIGHGGGYGMHINGGSNCANTDKYILQCWNGQREVMNVNGKGNMFVTNELSAGSLWVRKNNYLYYPEDASVYENIFDAMNNGTISKNGDASWWDDSSYRNGSWPENNHRGRRMIRLGIRAEWHQGLRINVPGDKNVVWVRILNDRSAAPHNIHWAVGINLYGLDGTFFGNFSSGRRRLHKYAPDGGTQDIMHSHFTWMPIPLPGNGGSYILSPSMKTPHRDIQVNTDAWVAGIAFTTNPWSHAMNSAIAYHWTLNGGSGVDWSSEDWNNDQLARINDGETAVLYVPNVPNGKDKLLYFIEHNNNWDGSMNGGIKVADTPIERLRATWDHPLARSINSKMYNRFLAARIPESLARGRFLEIKMDLTAGGGGFHFREAGTIDMY